MITTTNACAVCSGGVATLKGRGRRVVVTRPSGSFDYAVDINQCACGGVVTVIRLAVAVLAVWIQLCFDNRNQS